MSQLIKESKSKKKKVYFLPYVHKTSSKLIESRKACTSLHSVDKNYSSVKRLQSILKKKKSPYINQGSIDKKIRPSKQVFQKRSIFNNRISQKLQIIKTQSHMKYIQNNKQNIKLPLIKKNSSKKKQSKRINSPKYLKKRKYVILRTLENLQSQNYQQ